ADTRVPRTTKHPIRGTSRAGFSSFSDVSRNRIPSRGMRSRKAPLFFVLSFAAFSALVLSVACGGKDEAKSPGSSGGVASAAPFDTPATPDTSSGGTSTTTQLDASDLQGQKLQSGSKKEIETKGDGGPRPSGSDEPGRRRDDIKTIILTHRDEARACYDKALKDHPGIEGDL